jgi:hypothetical protein
MYQIRLWWWVGPFVIVNAVLEFFFFLDLIFESMTPSLLASAHAGLNPTHATSLTPTALVTKHEAVRIADCTHIFSFLSNVIDSYLESRDNYDESTSSGEVVSAFQDLSCYSSVENVRTAYIVTTPKVKLFYAEPFIASPSFIHTDLTYLYILQYQFWLWFLFVFLIIFFFLSFVSILRWVSLRVKPRRETRGVSRSKCGDFITATVPVTWATSIIVTESTDAADYYDNFATSELMIGIRAYQWGWEYYYPRSLDLHYSTKPAYSTFVGNSLKYNRSSGDTLSFNTFWRFYQNNTISDVISPAHVLLLPTDNAKLFSFLNFADLGKSREKPYTAFTNTQRFSKTYKTNLVHTPSTFTDKYVKLNNFFTTESNLTSSTSYGMVRQHNLTSIAAVLNNNAAFLDQKSFKKFLTYTMRYNSETHYARPSARLFRPYQVTHSASLRSLNTVAFSRQLATPLTGDSGRSGTNHFSNSLFTWVANLSRTTQVARSLWGSVALLHYPLDAATHVATLSNVGSAGLFNRSSLPTSAWLNRMTPPTLPLLSTVSGGFSVTSPWFQSRVMTPFLTPKAYQDLGVYGTYTPMVVSVPHIKLHLRSVERFIEPREGMTVASPRFKVTSNASQARTQFLNRYFSGRLSLGQTPLASNLVRLEATSATTTPLYFYRWQKTLWSDLSNFNRLASARLRFAGRVTGGAKTPPMFSTAWNKSKLRYDAIDSIKPFELHRLERTFAETYYNMPSLDRDLLFYTEAARFNRTAVWPTPVHAYMYDFFLTPYTKVSSLVDLRTFRPYYMHDDMNLASVKMVHRAASQNNAFCPLRDLSIPSSSLSGSSDIFAVPKLTVVDSEVTLPAPVQVDETKRPAYINVTDPSSIEPDLDDREGFIGLTDMEDSVERHSSLGLMSGSSVDTFAREESLTPLLALSTVGEFLSRTRSCWRTGNTPTLNQSATLTLRGVRGGVLEVTEGPLLRYNLLPLLEYLTYRSFPAESCFAKYSQLGVGLRPALQRDLGYSYPITGFKGDALMHSRLTPRIAYKTFVPVGVRKSLKKAYTHYKAWSNLFTLSSTVKLNTVHPFSTPRSAMSVVSRYFDEYVRPRWLSTPQSVSGVGAVDCTPTSFKVRKIPSYTFGDFDAALDSLESASTADLRVVTGWDSNPTRLSRLFTVRKGWKGFKTYLKAYAKVMHPRIDRGNSFATSGAFANVYPSRTFLNDQATSVLKGARLFGKNRERFFTVHNYVNRPSSVFNDLGSNFNMTNYYFYEFPFLLGKKSDASKYSWFDWYSRWYTYQVTRSERLSQTFQGLVSFRSRFHLTKSARELLKSTEDRMVRRRHLRHNPISAWVGTLTHTHYRGEWGQVLGYTNPQAQLSSKASFVAYNRVHSGGSLQFEILKNVWVDMKAPLRTYLNRFPTWPFTHVYYVSTPRKVFTPSFSWSYRCSWRPYTSVQAYNYNTLVLSDLLTKREGLYRKYLELQGAGRSLPVDFTATPSNSLLTLIRSSFLITSPTTLLSEVSRDFYLTSAEYFQFLVFKSWVNYYFSKFSRYSPYTFDEARNLFPIRLPLVNEYLFFYFCGSKLYELGNVSDLYKSQYRPLRKGVMNMIRLQMSGTVALPIEVRLQVMASSKDVIHSWAIPSAGIKIDCVPGYTSHRIMIFFTPGIYWGQCMEICGRYHHWMPIILYFMKRDLFVLWCTHFLHHKDSASYSFMSGLNNRQFTSWLRFASYDRQSWLSDSFRNL